MALRKFGHPVKLEVIKSGAFAFDANLIAKKIEEAIPSKKLSMDQLHESIKSLGITDYTSSDLGNLINLLKAAGFSLTA